MDILRRKRVFNSYRTQAGSRAHEIKRREVRETCRKAIAMISKAVRRSIRDDAYNLCRIGPPVHVHATFHPIHQTYQNNKLKTKN
jgi:hypothetical protein